MNVMTHKINTYVSATADSARNNVKSVDPEVRSNGSNTAVPSVAKADSVKLTPDAVQLHKLESSIAQIPVADHQRVAKVRQTIEDGTYKVDTQKIANKLARMEWDLSVK